jgi:magnesium chelatase family protein
LPFDQLTLRCPKPTGFPEEPETLGTKLSGPLLDRIDLHVAVPALRWRDLDGTAATETSGQVRARVQAARERQEARLRGTPWASNADLSLRGVRRDCPVERGGLALLERAVDRLGLSGRAYVRVLRVARTIADLANDTRLKSAHLAEAIGYRILDRGAGRSLP